ncbi:MAG: methyltransferase domain-containing protein [Bryobacteraceae bacterium]
MVPLWRIVRKELRRYAGSNGHRPRILDVGGRKSHYTVGVPADVWVSDIPRKSAVQHQLHLGTSDSIIGQIKSRRTNVRHLLYDDMTNSSIRSGTFDGVVSVEVLEHVERDGDFVREVSRVLKPGGFFLMTTPNGESIVNNNPDHKRHYTRLQLEELLKQHFSEVRVEYAVRDSKHQAWGLASWSPRKPVGTLKSMLGNQIAYRQSSAAAVKIQAIGTHHLIAHARNP